MVVEVVDSKETVERVIPQVQRMCPSGLITLEALNVIRYG
jgi:PII-like signaling protein